MSTEANCYELGPGEPRGSTLWLTLVHSVAPTSIFLVAVGTVPGEQVGEPLRLDLRTLKPENGAVFLISQRIKITIRPLLDCDDPRTQISQQPFSSDLLTPRIKHYPFDMPRTRNGALHHGTHKQVTLP